MSPHAAGEHPARQDGSRQRGGCRYYSAETDNLTCQLQPDVPPARCNHATSRRLRGARRMAQGRRAGREATRSSSSLVWRGSSERAFDSSDSGRRQSGDHPHLPHGAAVAHLDLRFTICVDSSEIGGPNLRQIEPPHALDAADRSLQTSCLASRGVGVYRAAFPDDRRRRQPRSRPGARRKPASGRSCG
jgi:hypothetical protein